PRPQSTSFPYTTLFRSELTGLSAEARKKLVEGVAEPDDQLVEKYLADGDLSRDDITRGLQAGTLAGSFVPVVCGSAARNIGTSRSGEHTSELQSRSDLV